MNADSNPSAPNAATASKSSSSLKYLAYGIYLQLFIGIGLIAFGAFGLNMGSLFDGPTAFGCVLIGLGLNSLIYVQRFKQSLK